MTSPVLKMYFEESTQRVVCGPESLSGRAGYEEIELPHNPLVSPLSSRLLELVCPKAEVSG